MPRRSEVLLLDSGAQIGLQIATMGGVLAPAERSDLLAGNGAPIAVVSRPFESFATEPAIAFKMMRLARRS
jgi:hypothetical protein